MAWQRTIPFGYQMRQGKIICEQSESGAVKNIFSLYLAGESLKRIAEIMSESGIRYHRHTEQWNKNMVKRVLENAHYLGDEDYPKIIDNNDFLAVRLQKADRDKRTPCRQEHHRGKGRVRRLWSCYAARYEEPRQSAVEMPKYRLRKDCSLHGRRDGGYS